MVNWCKVGTYCARLWGAYSAERRKTLDEWAAVKSNLASDTDIETCGADLKNLLADSLNDCSPSDLTLSKKGRRKLCKALKKEDLFDAYLSIDGNTVSTSRQICIRTLKFCARCIILGINVEDIRAATFTHIACR